MQRSHLGPNGFVQFASWFVGTALCVVLSGCGGSSDSGSGTPGGGTKPAAYTIGGALSGLPAGTTLVLEDNGGDSLTVSANGAFTFKTALAAGAAYKVSVATQPQGASCSVTNGAGTVAGADVTSVVIKCTALGPPPSYTVGGTVSGLVSGGSVGLADNGADALLVTSNAAFTFKTALASGAAYAVTVIQQPTGETCAVTRGSGTIGSGDVTNVTVVCSPLASACTASDPPGTVKTLFSFGGSYGANPQGALIEGQDGNYYGTTSHASSETVNGTLFKITPTGTATTLHVFPTPALPATPGMLAPTVGLVQGSDGTLYGVDTGASTDFGTVFSITPSGTFTTLFAFDGTDGAYPDAPLVLANDGNFYDTTVSPAIGTIFEVTPSGTHTTLYTFTSGLEPNSLIQGSDGNFYGTTPEAVFSFNPASGLKTLYTFSGGSDGSYPNGLVEGPDGNFYGTTSKGGNGPANAGGYGTVFKITPSGTLTTLHSFNGSDGQTPLAGLVFGSDGNLYGTTSAGGASPNDTGTVFMMTPAGALTTLHSFGSIAEDGLQPLAAVVEGSDGNYYGTTNLGGATDDGTVFVVCMAP